MWNYGEVQRVSCSRRRNAATALWDGEIAAGPACDGRCSNAPLTLRASATRQESGTKFKGVTCAPAAEETADPKSGGRGRLAHLHNAFPPQSFGFGHAQCILTLILISKLKFR